MIDLSKIWLKTSSNSQIKKMLFINFIAILAGIVGGYGAIGFRFLIGFFQNIFFYDKLDFHLISPISHVRGLWVIIIPPLGLLVVSYLVRWFAYEAKGHGVPEVIEAVLFHGGKIRKRVVAVKALASSLTIATGGSVGREGPIVQIGSAAGSTLGQLFKLNTGGIKTLVGCGAAAAISSTFNTPVAGVIFAIEIIVLELRTESFVPLVISSVIACVISRHYLGNEPAFFIPKHTLVHGSELIYYLGLGILAGIIGALVIWTLYKTEDIFNESKLPFYVKPVVAGLILGSIGYFFPQIFGVGYETVSNALNENLTLQLLISLIFLKIIAMSVTFGGGGSGGVFAPSLFIGAMLGGAFGYIVQHYSPGISASYGAYALVGMAALFAATSRATFTAIVILFEMTLDYSIILPLMFACVIADQVAVFISKYSIYTLKLKRRGFDFIEGFGVHIFAVTPIREIMSKDLIIVFEDMNLKEAHETTMDTPHMIYPVVTRNRILVGMIRNAEITRGLRTEGPDKSVKDLMQPPPAVVFPSDTVLESLKKVDKSRDPRIVVVDRVTKKVLGVVSPTDYVRFHSKEFN